MQGYLLQSHVEPPFLLWYVGSMSFHLYVCLWIGHAFFWCCSDRFVWNTLLQSGMDCRHFQKHVICRYASFSAILIIFLLYCQHIPVLSIISPCFVCFESHYGWFIPQASRTFLCLRILSSHSYDMYICTFKILNISITSPSWYPDGISPVDIRLLRPAVAPPPDRRAGPARGKLSDTWKLSPSIGM